MDKVFVSLFWPQEENFCSSKVKVLSSATTESLNFDSFCKMIGKNEDQSKVIKEILTNICHDEDVIKYRQDVFHDIFYSEKLIDSIEEILNQLEYLKYVSVQSSAPEEATLWKLFSRFKELEGYVDCVTAIRQSLQKIDFKSDGLIRLKAAIEKICEDEEFKRLSKTVKTLNMEISEINSITLGINLDSSLNPSEVALVSVNKTKFKENSWLADLLPAKGGKNSENFGSLTRMHRLSEDRRDAIMYHLYMDIEKYLKPVVKELSAGLNRYTHICGQYLINLIPELTFYLCFVQLFRSMQENNMPFCKPQIAKIEDRTCTVHDVYNISLALHMLQQGESPSKTLILNDVKFDEAGRILIITGPNRGGKTVYTEAVGLTHVLFQAGVFVPASYASISPVDSIYSHFPADENQTIGLGRLGEETKRLNEIFQVSTNYSLILLNESLASTSFTEGLYIAQDIVKAFRYLGTRVIFNTHMHELAAYADTINTEVQGESKVISLVTGLVDGKRSYKIQPGAPLGKSYAMDIAIKYGLSYEQIIETVDKNSRTYNNQY